MKEIVCPVCGSKMEINETTGFAICTTCGTTVQVSNNVEFKTERIIDEAKIKQTELEIRKLEIEERRRLDERQDKAIEKKIKNKKLTKTLILSLILGGIAISFIGGFIFKIDNEVISAIGRFIVLFGVSAYTIGVVLAFIMLIIKLKNNKKEGN